MEPKQLRAQKKRGRERFDTDGSRKVGFAVWPLIHANFAVHCSISNIANLSYSSSPPLSIRKSEHYQRIEGRSCQLKVNQQKGSKNEEAAIYTEIVRPNTISLLRK
ncbi:hypothetical protein F0562_025431 [Nyssa sinensis]|uniref:Uncharacterized protein n=1 Tax=Nyssa sinensis TaxID=561372 RepID=A0A5J5BFM3_9ASTE|nr:hypothetical protein F0562_025431 [Nyssa sinensis]